MEGFFAFSSNRMLLCYLCIHSSTEIDDGGGRNMVGRERVSLNSSRAIWSHDGPGCCHDSAVLLVHTKAGQV